MSVATSPPPWRPPSKKAAATSLLLFIPRPVLEGPCVALAIGISTAVLFHPYDRALFLSSLDHGSENFWHRKYWPRPLYQGLSASVIQRGLSTGLYFPCEQLAFGALPRRLREDHARVCHAISGHLVGSGTALLTNTFSLAKFYAWEGRHVEGSVLQHIALLHRKLGLRQTLTQGLLATLLRDAVFGATFSGLRYHPPDASGGQSRSVAGLKVLVTSSLAALVATVGSSPFNYARNKQYQAAINSCALRDNRHGCVAATPSIPAVLGELRAEIARQPTLPRRLQLAQSRLRFGWGSLRVSLGMGVSALLWAQAQHLVNSLHT